MVKTAAQTTESSDAVSVKETIVIEQYVAEKRAEWDAFIENSKNGIFLFKRDYMEYHAERFADCSLMFRDENKKLIAVLPASLWENALVSHGGLTFGGVISGSRMKTPQMLEIFESLIGLARERSLKRVVYKAVPHIYHAQPAEEDLYALFRFDAQLVRRDVSTTIQINERLSLSKGRKWTVNQSRKNKIEVRECNDFETFIRLEAKVLAEKYKVAPVHTADEMKLLVEHFPDNIKLFAAFLDGEMLAGAIIYASQNVAHAQYLAASDGGKRLCALDAVLHYLITDYYVAKKYFDFGISTEQQGRYLNNGLIDFKESWGGRATVYDSYEIVI